MVKEQGRVVDVFEDLGADCELRPLAELPEVSRGFKQIALKEYGGRDLARRYLDTRGAQFKARNLRLREAPMEIEREVALTAPDVEDSCAGSAAILFKVGKDEVPAIPL